MARIGGSGKSMQNALRDLFGATYQKTSRNLLFELDDSVVTTMIFPHEFLHFFFAHFESEFERRWGANPALCERFWRELGGSYEGADLLRRHPHLKNRRDKSHLIPVVLHNDAGPFAKKQSAYTLSFRSVTGIGSELEVCWLICSWVKALFYLFQNRCWHYLDWSWDACAEGIFPLSFPGCVPFPAGSWRAEMAGKPLAQGRDGYNWCLGLIGHKCDTEHFANDLNLPHWNCEEPCGWCGSNRSNMPWTDVSQHAAWLATVHGPVEFANRHRLCAHPLWRSKFLCVLFYIFWFDCLHVLDNNGVCSHIIGNCLWSVLVFRQLPGCRNYEEALAELRRRIQLHYRTHRVTSQIPPLRRENLVSVSGTYPCLHGPGVKAANTRHLMPFVAALMEELDDGSEWAYHRRRVASYMDRLYAILYDGPMFLSAAEKLELKQVSHRLLLHYVWLSAWSARRGKLWWNFVYKFHYMYHLVQQANLINPRFAQSYTEESLVGKIMLIYKASCNGPFFAHVQRTVLKKWLSGLQCNFGEIFS